ncbi:MAG: hypothetical protein ACP5UL_05165 [Thermoplasmata archaeon]
MFNNSKLGIDYQEFLNIYTTYKKTGKVDLSKITFFKPSSLLPLHIFISKENINPDLIILPEDNNARTYYQYMSGDHEKYMYDGATYIPIIKIPTKKANNDLEPQKLISQNMSHLLDKINEDGNVIPIGVTQAIRYLSGELIDNVYQHSEFVNSWIMAQCYSKKKYLDLSIIDDGITIPGSLENECYSYPS